MPRFFFHIHNDEFYEDREGTVLPSLKEAWKQASQTCGTMLHDVDGKLMVGREWGMDVCDERGELLWRFRFIAEGVDPNG